MLNDQTKPSQSHRGGRWIHFGRWSSCSNESFVPHRKRPHTSSSSSSSGTSAVWCPIEIHWACCWKLICPDSPSPHENRPICYTLGPNASSVSMANRPEGCAFQRALSWVRWRIEFWCRCFPQNWDSMDITITYPLKWNYGPLGLPYFKDSHVCDRHLIFFVDFSTSWGFPIRMGQGMLEPPTGSYTGGWHFGAEGSKRGSQRKWQPRSRSRGSWKS